MRVGQGFDVHALVPGRRLVFGGVRLSDGKGAPRHSDADVLLHAICDALLGAAGMGDIGKHFPDSDPAYKDADSRKLLREVRSKIGRFKIVNIDATILAQEPRMAPHIARMTENIAADLGVGPGSINIKATTTEHLGFVGRLEGIAAQAVVLIE